MMHTNHDNAMATGLEQGMLALLGRKSASALRRLVPAPDLALACLALVAILRAAPRRAAVLGRASGLMAQVLFSTALDAVLRGVSATQDEGLACVSLLAIFYWGGALDPHGELSGPPRRSTCWWPRSRTGCGARSQPCSPPGPRPSRPPCPPTSPAWPSSSRSRP
jgi:hypothetical protein